MRYAFGKGWGLHVNNKIQRSNYISDEIRLKWYIHMRMSYKEEGAIHNEVRTEWGGGEVREGEGVLHQCVRLYIIEWMTSQTIAYRGKEGTQSC